MAIELKTKVPGPKSQALMKARLDQVARGPFHATPIFVARGEGAILEDVDGNKFIDLAGGIGVTNVGQRELGVTKAIHDQTDRFLHTSFNVTPYESYVAVCQKLNEKTPGRFPKKSFLANSGAEATENAVKIARAYTKKKYVVAFEHAFHGRTYMAMGLTAKETPYKAGFGPFPDGVIRVPFPYAYRWTSTGAVAEGDMETQAFEALVRELGKFQDDIAAIVVEPILGEGGFLVLPPRYAKWLEGYAREKGILLVADEIQCGFGRTGKLFASEALGIVPDLVLTAKGLGGGLPLSAVTGRADVMDAPSEGAIGGTFGGNPLSCRAALAVFTFFDNPQILADVEKKGAWLFQQLEKWKEKIPAVGDVRGLGMMAAVELVKDRKTKEPAKELTAAVLKLACERGVVALSAGTYGNVIRFLPPLTISQSELKEGLSVLESALKELA